MTNEGKMEELPGVVYTDKEQIHNLLVERNIQYFSLAEDTPQGINGFIYNALGPHGTSDFSDRVLNGNLVAKDKAGFELVEAEELFREIYIF